jgi:hypothetical protein
VDEAADGVMVDTLVEVEAEDEEVTMAAIEAEAAFVVATEEIFVVVTEEVSEAVTEEVSEAVIEEDSVEEIEAVAFVVGEEGLKDLRFSGKCNQYPELGSYLM